MGVACGRFVIGGPFRVFRPCEFKGTKGTDKRKDVRSKKEEEALGIVARATVGLLVGEGCVEFFGGKGVKHAARNKEARTKKTRQGEKGGCVFDDDQRRRFSRHADFLAGKAAELIVA